MAARRTKVRHTFLRKSTYVSAKQRTSIRFTLIMDMGCRIENWSGSGRSPIPSLHVAHGKFFLCDCSGMLAVKVSKIVSSAANNLLTAADGDQST